MPFRKRCKITITNEGRRPRLQRVLSTWTGSALPSLPDDAGYFHARYRQELPAVMGRHYEILNVRGRGHYVGTYST